MVSTSRDIFMFRFFVVLQITPFSIQIASEMWGNFGVSFVHTTYSI
jgi:hypothetical protein